MQQCTRVLFDSCEFRGFSKKLIHLTSPADKNTASRVAHCQFYYEGLPEALKKNLSGDNTIAEFGFCQLEDNLFYIDPNTLRIFGLPSCFDLLGTGAVIIPTVIRSPHDCH